MYGVLGICQTSCVYVVEHLISLCDEHNLKMAVVNEDNAANSHHQIFLYTSFDMFQFDLSELNHLPGITIVFDTPENLKRIDGVVLLDSTEEYSSDPLNVDKLHSTVLKLWKSKKTKPIRLLRRDPLLKLVQDCQRGRILHHYTRFIYSFTGARRDELRRLIVGYLFKDVKPTEFQTKVTSFLRKEQAQIYYDNLMQFINQEGQPLLQALGEMKRRHFSNNIDTEELANKYEVDAYEVNYLSKSYVDMFRSEKVQAKKSA